MRDRNPTKTNLTPKGRLKEKITMAFIENKIDVKEIAEIISETERKTAIIVLKMIKQENQIPDWVIEKVATRFNLKLEFNP